MSETLTVSGAPQTFDEKLKARIRESIGELMTDEDLKKILDRGVEEALFQRRIVPEGYGGTKQIPSLVDSVVTEKLAEKMKEAVGAWLAANPERIASAVDAAVKVGVGQCMLDALENKVGNALYQLRSDIQSRLSR